MIKITVEIGSNVDVMEFPKTSKGQKEGIKYLQWLKDEYIKHPWFFNTLSKSEKKRLGVIEPAGTPIKKECVKQPPPLKVSIISL